MDSTRTGGGALRQNAVLPDFDGASAAIRVAPELADYRHRAGERRGAVPHPDTETAHPEAAAERKLELQVSAAHLPRFVDACLDDEPRRGVALPARLAL